MCENGELNTKQLNIIKNALKCIELHQIEVFVNDDDESTMIVCEPYPNMHTIVNWHLNLGEIDIYTMKKVVTIKHPHKLYDTMMDAVI